MGKTKWKATVQMQEMRYFSDWQSTGTAYSEQVCLVSKVDN
jgi:hypothetical protein